jgi:hypothetical protein
VAILQRPVEVRHSIKRDKPITEILDNVVSDLTAKVLERFYGDDESKIPTINYLGVKPAPVPSLPGARVLRTGNEVKLTPASLTPHCRALPAGPRWI